MDEMTRAEFLEHMAALERRINERFDLLERMIALGFDDTSDQITMGIERFRGLPDSAISHDIPGRGSARRAPQPSHPPA